MSSPLLVHAPNRTSSTQQCDLGQIVEIADGVTLMYVLFDNGAVTPVSGMVYSWKDRDAFEVTCDTSAGITEFAGVFPASKRADTQYVPADGDYGYIQIAGRHPAVNKAAADDTFADGDHVQAGTDGICADCADVAAPSAAEFPLLIGVATGASENTATGTYNEDTVGVHIFRKNG